MLVMVPVGTAHAADLRFVHGIPGEGPAALEVNGSAGTEVGFGEIGPYEEAPNGSVTLALGDVEVTEELSAAGAYTAVAWRRDADVMLTLFRDGPAGAGQAKLRAVQVAGELGEVDVTLGRDKVASSIERGTASDYMTVEPGTYDLRVTRAGGGGSPLGASNGVSLAAGTSSTALVLGSGGAPLEVLIATDTVEAPAEGPATGLGGLDDGPPLLAALLAALAAGTLGAGAFRLARRRGA